MGLLNWFRGRPRRTSRLRIIVWLDEESQLRAFVAGVKGDLGRNQAVLVVAHFKEKLVEMGRLLAEAGVAFEFRGEWTAENTRQLCSGQATVQAVLASALPDVADDELPAGNANEHVAGGSPAASLRIADMHVLDEENQRLERFATSLSVPSSIASSLAFDDPVMEAFAKPWVKPMMERMGLTADQPIESPMVEKGVRKALQKLAKTATGNVPCDSLREWMRRNLRQ